jgi:dephospho-CoA kinase|tara:strand:- start:451 stop:1032 length:582 start_codon:yes stop_codon:yes gene_type:complete
MIKICIVGDIGSGKTYISNLFSKNKNLIFNADLEVNKIYNYNKNIFNKLKKKLPHFIKTFPTNKSEIHNAIIFNKSNLKKIIKIIHPEIRKKMNIFLKNNNKQKFVILDIPLLLENKLNKSEDVIVYVDAKKNILQKYLKKRAGYNQKIVEILKEMQILPERKKELSDIVIENNFNPKKMRLRARQVLDSIII